MMKFFLSLFLFPYFLCADLLLLEQRVKEDLKWINYPARGWSLNNDEKLYDVVVIGGGMAGMTAAFALGKVGVTHIKIFDENPEGLEGPWKTYARMRHLRSNKRNAGPALGVPSLTFQAWFKAQYSEEQWENLQYVPTLMWADYLIWYRKVLNLPVENDSRLTKIVPYEDRLELFFDGKPSVLARKVVLATGRGGSGGLVYPQFVVHLPKEFYIHSSTPIDFSFLAGKHIAIVGAGASAFDTAATALEKGVASVDMFMRRSALPTANKFAYFFLQGPSLAYFCLDDLNRAMLLKDAFEIGVPPPKTAIKRLGENPSFQLHDHAEIMAIQVKDSRLNLVTTKGNYKVDFLILGTGFEVDLSKKAELNLFADQILLWKDRVKGLNPRLGRFPYLGAHFQFLPRVKGGASFLKNLYCFNFGAFLSHSLLSGEIAGISTGAQRLAQGIAKDLFLQEKEAQLESFFTFAPGSPGNAISNETLERLSEDIFEFDVE